MDADLKAAGERHAKSPYGDHCTVCGEWDAGDGICDVVPMPCDAARLRDALAAAEARIRNADAILAQPDQGDAYRRIAMARDALQDEEGSGMSDIEAIVARHVKTTEEVHWPSGLVTHPESCLECDKPWPCDARILADALAAAEAERDAAKSMLWQAEQQNADLFRRLEAVGADADALARELHDAVVYADRSVTPAARIKAWKRALATHVKRANKGLD